MRKEYTVKEAAVILGISKPSLHSLINQGSIPVRKKVVNGVPYLFINGKDLEEYAIRKIEKLQARLDRMRMDLLTDEGE